MHTKDRVPVGYMLTALVLSCLISNTGCGGSPPAPTSPSAPKPPGPTAPDPRVIQIGEPISGAITSSDAACRFTTVEGGWDGLCNAFNVTAPATGTLVATARWATDAPLAMFFKTSAEEQIDLLCCGSPIVGQLPVEAGTTYRVELAYVGRPAGYPNVPSVPYTLGTALITSDEAQPRGTLSAIIFGDSSRTQRLSRARLEVADGPAAGTVARFNDATGLYEIPDLPAGFVQIRASAPGFVALDARLPVGSNIARELVLQRSEPLLDATHALGGKAFVASSTTTAYIGVKIEILDGPLAGIFTFTDDEFFGEYAFRGLPPGVIQVRASSERLQTQTVSVEVSGNTTLNFFMQSK